MAYAKPLPEPSEQQSVLPPRQRERKPFGALEQRMVAPVRPGYRRYWFNDEPGRIARAQEAGYEHVEESGKPISRVVGRSENSKGLIAYLMEIPEAWYEQDMAAQQAERDAKMREIREGKPSAALVENSYIDPSRTSFNSNRR